MSQAFIAAIPKCSDTPMKRKDPFFLFSNFFIILEVRFSISHFENKLDTAEI